MGANDVMRKMRNWAQLIFVAQKMRKFAPTRKPVALETLLKSENISTIAQTSSFYILTAETLINGLAGKSE